MSIESTNQTEVKNKLDTANIGKSIEFPNADCFPIHSILDVWEGYTQVAYFDDGLPQILWVPNDFIKND